MAVFYITEYAELAIGPAGRVGQMPMDPPVAEQTIAIGGASVASSAFNAKTRFIRLHTDAICSFEIGAATPTATATKARMAANQTEYHDVSRLPGGMVAVITNT
jgi:hypothetical protein